MRGSPDSTNTSTHPQSRRRFLAAAGGAVATGLLAGCSSQDGSSTNNAPEGTPTPTPEETPTPTVTPTGLPGTYFIDPANGRNANSGRRPSEPFRNLRPLSEKGRITLRPGDVMKLRATAPLFLEGSVAFYRVQGTEENPIVLEPYGDGRPVIDASDIEGNAIVMEGAQYITLRGFELRNVPNDGIRVTGAAQGDQQALGCVFEDLEIHHYGQGGSDYTEGNGIGTYRDSYGHTFRDVVCHHGGIDDNSDGFYIGGRNLLRSGGHRFERCVAYLNADDGFDFFKCDPERTSTLIDCVAYHNGRDGEGATGDGNGFKMGGGWLTGGNHVIRSVAYENAAIGFDCNGASSITTFDNCTSYDSGTHGFEFTGATDGVGHIVRNCISFGSGEEPANLLYNARAEANTWDLEIEDPGFASLEATTPDFLHLAPDSPCIDAGVDIGVSFEGPAPDLGAFEYSG